MDPGRRRRVVWLRKVSWWVSEQRLNNLGDDITGLQELISMASRYGCVCRSCSHSWTRSDEVYGFFHETLDFLTKNDPTVDSLLQTALRVGEVNLTVMGLLDAANTGAYGHPLPTPVRIEPLKGKAIVVSVTI